MAGKTIPKDIQQEILTRVEQFNQQELQLEKRRSLPAVELTPR